MGWLTEMVIKGVGKGGGGGKKKEESERGKKAEKKTKFARSIHRPLA